MFVQFVQRLLSDHRLSEGAVWARRRFLAGDTLTAEGALGRSLFIIETGRLAVLGWAQLPGRPSIEVTLAELTAGNVFGESSLIGDYESIATVRALTDGSAIEINGAMLSVYLDDNPHQGYLFFKYLLAMALDNLAKSNRGVVELAALGLKLHGLAKAGI